MTFLIRQSYLGTRNENMPELYLAFLNNLKWKNMLFQSKYVSFGVGRRIKFIF